MYNGGYSGNQHGFSIQNYAPSDPMAEIPGFQMPNNPQQVQGPPASSSTAPIRGQTTSSNPSNVNTIDRHRISTEEMRRDFERSAVYIPTPINNMPTGAGSLARPTTQSASQHSVAPSTSNANQSGTNQQQRLAPVPPRAVQGNQAHPVFLTPQQHQLQQIQNSQRNLNPAQVIGQNILASLIAHQPMPATSANQQQHLHGQFAQQLGAPRNPGPPAQPPGLSSPSFQQPPNNQQQHLQAQFAQQFGAPVALGQQQSRNPGLPAQPPGLSGPSAQQPPINQRQHLQAQFAQQLGAPRNTGPPAQPPPPPNRQPIPPETTRVQDNPEIFVFNQGHPLHSDSVLVGNQRINLLHFFEHVRSSNSIPLSEMAAWAIRIRLPPNHFHHIPPGTQLPINNARVPPPAIMAPPGPPPPREPNAPIGNAAQSSSAVSLHMNVSIPPPPPGYRWPSREEFEHHQRSHQRQIQQMQNHVIQTEAQRQQNAQQIMNFQQEQQRIRQHQLQQMQQMQQQQHRPSELPNHQQRQQQQPQQQPTQLHQQRQSQQPQQATSAESRVGISADETAPPCAYTPTSTPPLNETSEAPEVKPDVRRPEKPSRKKKTIEVITLEDEEPLVRVKSEPVDREVSSTTDARAAPVSSVSVKREPDRVVEQESATTEPPRHNVSVKSEPMEYVRRIAEQTIRNEGLSSGTVDGRETRQNQMSEDEKIQAQAIKYLKDIMKLPPELRPEFIRDFQGSSIQESKVTTSQVKPVKGSRSRSSSAGSDIITMRKKKKVLEYEDSDDPDEADEPSTSAGRINRDKTHVESTPSSPGSIEAEYGQASKEGSRREKRPVAYDESDDEMPVVQKKKKKSKRISSDEDEWQDQGNQSSEEEMDDEDFIVPDNELEEEEEDSMRDFIVSDEEDVEYEEELDDDRRRHRKEKKKEKNSRSRPARGRSSDTRRAEISDRPKSVSDRRRTSEVNPKSPISEEEKRRLRNEKTRRTREENREKARLARLEQHNEMYATINKRTAEVPQSSAIKEYHQSNKRDSKPKSDIKEAQRERQRRDEPATDKGEKRFQKRATSEDLDDEGVHVPAKRKAHSNSVPGPSRDRPTSAVPPARNRPSQTDMDKKRYAEAEAKKEKERNEYEELKKQKHLTEGQKMRLMKLKSMLEPKPASRQAPSKPQTSSKPSTSTSAVFKKVVIKKEISSPSKARAPSPRPSTPPYLEPSYGRSFLGERKEGIRKLFKYLLDGNKSTASIEAQKIELELAKKYTDQFKYKNAVRSRLYEINRKNNSGILEVNQKAVSHSQILSGAPKENCLVAKGRKVHVDYRSLPFEQLQPLLVPFKMSDAELETNAYPLFPAGSRTAKIAETTYTQNKKMFLDASDLSRSCSRCQKEFKLSPDGSMIRIKDICRYHNRGTNRNGKRDTFQKRYTCCNEEYNSTPGCKFSDVHVFDQLYKKELSTFVPTPPPRSPNDPRSNTAYALDCEMVYTVSGPALARLTMVNMKKQKVLDLFIKPPTEVLDPNTEFSGLTMEDIQNAKDTMETCHKKLFNLVNSETILIGHSLESDLKAMRIVHKSVIDTAILFRSSGDFKIALKNLSSKFLGKTIQGDNEDAVGHDSLEDANTCVDLIFHGLKNPECIVIRKLSS